MTPSFSTLNIILPVGISFYTFQAMSYLFDIYRNKIECEPSIIKFATFIALFPKLVAGPIVRASVLLHQLSKDQIYSSKRFFDGLRIVLYGYFIKTVIADSIAPVVNVIYSQAETGSSLNLLIGVFLFSFQIYCDFHGYSLIAIGLGKMMGFDFGVNFNTPYLSTNFSVFWKRWHISLSSWLRDYLYIPLGGNKKGALTTCRNVLITMFLCGLWHGASWSFVIWGLLHGGYLIAQNIIKKIISSLKLPKIKMLELPIKISSILLVFLLTSFAWIFFRAPDLNLAFVIINKIILFDNFDIYSIPEKFIVIKCFILISMLMTVEVINSFNRNLLNNPVALYLSIPIILWGIALLGTFAGTSFIYIQF
jgi:D-alanyl-lipoteichoic acid acyltransferase DltB (MBOAT superfamily)